MVVLCLCIVVCVGATRETFFRVSLSRRFGIGTGWSLFAVLLLPLLSVASKEGMQGYPFLI
jgi:hypothetical protein